MKHFLYTLIAAMLLMSVGIASAQEPGERPMREGRPDGDRRGGLHEDVISAIQEAAGLDEAAFREEFAAGGTLSDLASAHGVDPDAVIAAAKADATEHLNEAVAEGRITQAEADEKLATIDQRLAEIMNTTFQDAIQHRLVEGSLMHAVRDSLNLERGDLGEVVEGQTLADFINAQGGDVATISAAALTDLQEHVAEEVVEGHLTQAQADQIVAGAGAAITEALNAPFRPHRPGHSI